MQEMMIAGGSGGYYPWSGPGSKKLVQGTLTLGYFGIVTQAEFIDRDTLRSLGPASLSAYNIGTMTWHKFALDGKILLIPRTCIALVQPRHVYYTGFMYGTDDNGKYPSGSSIASLGIANQKRIVERDGYRYRVRTLRGSAKDTDQLVDISSPETPDLVNSEYCRTKGRMCRDQYSYSSGRPRWGMQAASVTTTNVSTGSLTTAVATNNSCITRGTNSTVDAFGSYGVTSSVPWAPVLELEL